jgi:hypothetical protein
MKSIPGLVAGASRAAFARVLVALGRLHLARRDAARAARAFERAVRVDPDGFSSWLHLGRARLRERDLLRARRAFARAREASPARFEVEAALWARREGFELASLSDVGRRPEPPSRHPAYLGAPGSAAKALPYGDCKDLDEYARFGAMPPITASEWDDVDWDELAEDLQDG